MLGPHRRVHASSFRLGSRPSVSPVNLELVVAQPELPPEVGRERVGHRPTPAITDQSGGANSACPPVGPTSEYTACSGCGISPTTLPASLREPRGSPRKGAVRVLGVATHSPSGPQ